MQKREGNRRHLVAGGKPFYGEAIGILLNKTTTPLLPGNVGNASTYKFPVRMENIERVTWQWLPVEREKGVNPKSPPE